MDILINDKDNTLASLQEAGFSQEAIEASLEIVKQLYTKHINMIFSEIIKKDLPKTLELRLVKDERHGKLFVFSAYSPTESDTEKLVFLINKIFIEKCLKFPNSKFPAFVITHELLHAADPSYARCIKRLDELMEDGVCSFSTFSLYNTIQLLKKIRAEGVAELGSHLLCPSNKIESVDYLIKAFRDLFAEAMSSATSSIIDMDFTADKDVNVDDQRNLLYRSTPLILLLVLEKTGNVDNKLVQKALRTFETGVSDLTEKETHRIIQSALTLNTVHFIQGLLLLGEASAPVKTILDYFKAVQEDDDKDNEIDSLARLLDEPKTAEVFHSVIEQIIGTNVAIDLDARYHTFCMNPPDVGEYPGLKEKVDLLFTTMKTDKDPKRKQIAQEALAYFFDEKGAINDDVYFIGMVDNLIVIDYALALLCFSISILTNNLS